MRVDSWVDELRNQLRSFGAETLNSEIKMADITLGYVDGQEIVIKKLNKLKNAPELEADYEQTLEEVTNTCGSSAPSRFRRACTWSGSRLRSPTRACSAPFPNRPNSKTPSRRCSGRRASASPSYRFGGFC